MAARASLLADGDQAVHRARHGAAHEQEIALGVDPYHPQAELGGVARAHMPGHALAFDDARRVGARRDRSRLAVTRVAVRLGTAMEVMAVHDTLEAAALRDAADLHAIAFGEDGDGDGAAGGRRFAAHVKAPNHARRRLDAALLRMARERLGGVLGLLRAEAELHAPLEHGDDGTRPGLDHRDGHVGAGGVEDAGHSQFSTDQSVHNSSSTDVSYSTLISTSTPAGRSSFVSASTVCDRESRMSISRLCVLSSNCSRLFLSMCGLRSTVQSCRLVGSGIGPETFAPVFSAVRTMSAAAWSMRAWSNALRRMRILPAIRYLDSSLLPDLRGDSRAHRPATLADREAEAFLHRDRRDQLDRHLRIVARHHHLHPRRQ